MAKFNCSDVSLISQKNGYDGFFKIIQYTLTHRMFNGDETRPLVRECFERGHAVGVLAYDPLRDAIVLLEQFRIGAYVNEQANKQDSTSQDVKPEASNANSPWLLEIIAGIVEPGEKQEEVAHREAFEEAGCRLLAMEPIGDFYCSPGGTSETIQLFCACVNSEGVGGIHGLEGEGEDIRAMVVDYPEAVEWLKSGRLNNASTMIAMQWLMLNRDEIRDKWLNSPMS